MDKEKNMSDERVLKEEFIKILEDLRLTEYKQPICKACMESNGSLPVCAGFIAIYESIKDSQEQKSRFAFWFVMTYKSMQIDGFENKFLNDIHNAYGDFLDFAENMTSKIELVFDGIFSNIEGAESITSRTIGKNEVDGLTVSTVNTIDMGFETAIRDKNGYNPVERYGNEIDAKIGHYQWCKNIVGMDKVTRLGYGPQKEEEIVLERNLPTNGNK